MTVMLLHDLGDPRAGAAWRAAAPDDWIVPDLPGHGETPAVRTGHYDPMAVVALARWELARHGEATLVGVRANAHSALVHAATGACARVVVVDGLWGPWRTPEESIDDLYGFVRAVAADPDATAPAPTRGLDPRTRHGYGVLVSARFARLFWGSIDRPVLAIETPGSPTPAAERDERLAWFGGATTLVELGTDHSHAVVGAIEDWMT